MNEKEQCKDLQRIIEEERELQGNIGDDVMDMLIASAIYAEGYRKVPIGSVIVPIEERETIEKRVEELRGKGAHIEIENYELMKTARALFDASARTTATYVAFRQLLDVSDFALHSKERIYEANAEIDRLKADNEALQMWNNVSAEANNRMQEVCVLRGEEIERLRAEIKKLRGEK